MDIFFSDEDSAYKFQHKGVEITFYEWDYSKKNQDDIIKFIDNLSDAQIDEIAEILPDYKARILNIFYFGMPKYKHTFRDFTIEEFYSFVPSNKENYQMNDVVWSASKSLWIRGSNPWEGDN